ncbi:MAG: cation:proton antiporter [Gammaproteobacteria bacterium]|nr:cation:proton antiporter [Gammaproteobacteria bacterium]MDH3857554.1 cation:proton antiporter [Gammaproteobacteria bacterium]
MDIQSLAIIAGGLLLFSLISGRLRDTIITAPLVFVGFGLVVGSSGVGVAHIDPGHGMIHFIAECTLILVLFTDAARIKLGDVRIDHNLPQRMLVLGLPLTMLCGALVAVWLFPAFSLWEAALLAALLAPTDAALGQSVVSAKAVPARIRQAINIESGLNDGIALPAVLLFASLAGAAHGTQNDASMWVQFGLMQLVLGPIVGIIIGATGAVALDRAVVCGWMGDSYQGIAILALAILIYVAAELIGGNGFIAVFIGGMVFGNRLQNACTFLFEFMETEGQLLMLITFLIFGAVMLPQALEHAGVEHLVYALLSLTVVRMLPILLSLIATGVRLPTQLFLGWFGPRGLASVLFLLLIIEESDLPQRDEIFTVTVLTVTLSALLHGVSAAPLANAYARLAAGMGECEENMPAVEIPLREGHIIETKQG